jgi:hypothetical protein
MNKNDILKGLKVRTQKMRLRLPDDMDFEIQGDVLTITLSEKGVLGNMQDDPSAFEGWALCLKAWLPKLIKHVSIEWGAKASLNDLHYMRFLYRLWKFVGIFDWATTNSYNFDNYNSKGWVANFPKKEAKINAANGEAQLERDYVNNHKSEFDVMNHQLPVGIFKGYVAEKNGIMPRGGSQLDIWAIKDDELYVFELKKDDNSKVGIISELMFYCNIMDDLMTHRINYTDDAQNCTFRDFGKLYHSYKNRTIKKINGVFLTNKFHSLISPEVINLMNTNPVRIKYSQQTVSNL